MTDALKKAITEILGEKYENAAIKQIMSEVAGMSSLRNLAILQACVRSFPKCAYLEIGLYKGLSARAAMLGNDSGTFHLVDSFVEEAKYGSYREECTRNINAGAAKDKHIYPMDGLTFLVTTGGVAYDVFYYDGDHAFDATYTALSMARYRVKKGGIILVDDTNYGHVRQAVMHTVNDFGYTVDFDLWTPHSATGYCWNGLMVLTV